MISPGLAGWVSTEAVCSHNSTSFFLCSIAKSGLLTETLSIAIFGPAATTWFKFLQNNVNLKSTKATIAARVVADQTLFAPTNMFMFLSSMSIMEGTDPVEKLKKTWWPGYKANCMVWPAVQTANFSIVPLQHRVLVVNVISLGWNCFLSIINSEG